MRMIFLVSLWQAVCFDQPTDGEEELRAELEKVEKNVASLVREKAPIQSLDPAPDVKSKVPTLKEYFITELDCFKVMPYPYLKDHPVPPAPLAGGG